MRLFIDTSAFIARYHSKDRCHKEAMDYTEQIKTKEAGITELYTSDYVIDEMITTIFARTGSFELAKKYGEAIIASKVVNKIWVDQKSFNESWELFKKQGEIGLSFTDSTSLILMRKNGIYKIFTFDEHFKKLGLNVVP
jgi:hypothetical protein